METYLDRFVKIIRFEARQGYANKAVTGGLDHLNQSWPSEARLAGLPETTIARVSELLRNYPGYDPLQRREAILHILALLDVETGSLPPLDASATALAHDATPGKKNKPASPARAGATPAVVKSASRQPAGSAGPVPASQSEAHLNSRSEKVQAGQQRSRAYRADFAPSQTDPVGLSAPATVIRGIGGKTR